MCVCVIDQGYLTQISQVQNPPMRDTLELFILNP